MAYEKVVFDKNKQVSLNMSAGLSLGKCGCPNNNILVISFWKDLNGLHEMTPSPAGIFLYP